MVVTVCSYESHHGLRLSIVILFVTSLVVPWVGNGMLIVEGGLYPFFVISLCIFIRTPKHEI